MHTLKGSKSSGSSDIIFRIIRSGFAVLILSGFVLAISFGVKTVSTMSISRIYLIATPMLDRAHINIDEAEVGKVAGAFVNRLSQTKIEKPVENSDQNAPAGTSIDDSANRETSQDASNIKEPVSIAVLADVHGDWDNLRKALAVAESRGIRHIVYLGDYTDYGVTADLQKAKQIMDNSGLVYFSLPGDHDLAQSVGPSNFISVFGTPQFSFSVGGFKMVGLDNSANYTPIASDVMGWFQEELTDASVVFLSQPLYAPFSSSKMGWVRGTEEPSVSSQAMELLSSIRESPATLVVTADLHSFSKTPDPVNPSLTHIVVGALETVEGVPFALTPRFVIVSLSSSGGFDVEEVMLE